VARTAQGYPGDIAERSELARQRERIAGPVGSPRGGCGGPDPQPRGGGRRGAPLPRKAGEAPSAFQDIDACAGGDIGRAVGAVGRRMTPCRARSRERAKKRKSHPQLEIVGGAERGD